jgi:hypothetical protein
MATVILSTLADGPIDDEDKETDNLNHNLCHRCSGHQQDAEGRYPTPTPGSLPQRRLFAAAHLWTQRPDPESEPSREVP